MHIRLLEMAEEGKSYISVVYNIGLIVVIATALGLLMGKITDLLSHENQTPKTTGTTGKVDPK
jgi:hypothetical protein